MYFVHVHQVDCTCIFVQTFLQGVLLTMLAIYIIVVVVE